MTTHTYTPNKYIVPAGFISLPELAELAEMPKSRALYHLRKAGVAEKTIPRIGTHHHPSGGRPMLIFPQREAFNVVLQ